MARVPGEVPFPDPASAWFWAVEALIARHDGAMVRHASGPRRPCDPDDVLAVFNLLMTRHRLGDRHAHVLGVHGREGLPPDPRRSREDARLWAEAMGAMDWPLRARGIVA